MQKILSLKRIFVLLFICSSLPIFSQYKHEEGIDYYDHSKYRLDFTLLDLPYQKQAAENLHSNYFSTFQTLSPQQSFEINNTLDNLYYKVLVENATKKWIPSYLLKTSPRKSTKINTLFFTAHALFAPFVYSKLPGSVYWYRTEFQKSVALYSGIDATNPYYNFEFDSRKNISGVKDQTIAQLKKTNPIEINRINSSQNEAIVFYAQESQIISFLRYPSRNPYIIFALINFLPEAFTRLFLFTDLFTADDKNKTYSVPNDVAKRTFTGPDNLATFTYDLFNPNADYFDRGVDDNGNVNRYYSYSNLLSSDERDFYNKQKALQYINLLRPSMFGLKQISFPNHWKGIFGINHSLSPFGNDISLMVLVKRKQFKLGVIYHQQQNYKNEFPAIELFWLDIPLTIFNKKIFFYPRVFMGVQPKNLAFKTDEDQFVYKAQLKISLPIVKGLYINITPSMKSEGWIIGDPVLKETLALQTSLSYLF